MAEDKEVSREDVRVKTNGDFIRVSLSVVKIQEPESVRGLFLITFRPQPLAVETIKTKGSSRGKRVNSRAGQLEHRVAAHQGITANHDRRTGDHRTRNSSSTNEELQSTNEELQSTNEEMETAKEEMQSLNEELNTVNAEMQAKVADLSQANDDMQNLLNSIEIATIFLDNNLTSSATPIRPSCSST